MFWGREVKWEAVSLQGVRSDQCSLTRTYRWFFLSYNIFSPKKLLYLICCLLCLNHLPVTQCVTHSHNMRETGYVQVHVCVCVSLWSETLPAALHKPVMITEASYHQLYHSTCSNKILLKWHHHRWCEEGEPAWTKVLCVLTSHHLGCSAHTAPKSRRHFHDHISGGFQLPIKPLGPHLWWVPTEMTVNPHHKWALRATWQGEILLPPKSQNPWGGGMLWGLKGLKWEMGPWQVWGNSLQETTEEQMGSMVNVSFPQWPRCHFFWDQNPE